MSDKKIRLYHKTVLCAVFAVFAAITGIVESLCGIDAFFPVPGVRLGLANLFILAAFVLYGGSAALAVSLVRMCLVFLFTGNSTAFVLSFGGSICAFCALCTVMPLYGKKCTLIGVSACSSACHGIGQLLAAHFLVRTPVFWYLPLLCALSALTGCLVGALLDRLLPLFPEKVRKNTRYQPIYAFKERISE